MARSAPMARAVRKVSWDCAGPIDTATVSVALPDSFSRTASSTAISSKGFMDILTLASSTPLPSALTRIFTLKSTTRLTATRTFINSNSSRGSDVLPQFAPDPSGALGWRQSRGRRSLDDCDAGSRGRSDNQPRSEDDGQHEAGGKATDMGRPSHHGGVIRGEQQHEDLEREPAGQNVDGGNPHRQPHEEEDPDAGTRVEQHVGGKNAADGAGSADEGRVRCRGEEGVEERGADAAGDIEQQKRNPAEGIFDVIGEHPEKKHV